MTKPEWGTKRTCQSCSTRFYDMKKKQPVCPKCDAKFELDNSPKSRRARLAAEEAAKKAKKAKPEDIEDIAVNAEGDAESVLEDADELEEDLDVEKVVIISKDEAMESR